MPISGDEISVQLQRHYFKRKEDDDGGLIGWGSFILPISVGGDYILSAGFSLILNGSFITEHAAEEMLGYGIQLEPSAVGSQRFWLRSLRIAGHDLPDIEVRIGEIPEQLGLDALLGRNFLTHFASLRYGISSHVITLVRS